MTYLSTTAVMILIMSSTRVQGFSPSSVRPFSPPQRIISKLSTNRPSQLCASSSSEDEEPTSSKPSATTTKADSIQTSSKFIYYQECPYSDGTKPESAPELALDNFIRQGSSIVVEALASINLTGKSYVPPAERPPDVFGFTLSNEAVQRAEELRERYQPAGKVETNPASRLLYDVGCFALDELFPERPIARFWFLEIIARIPYFSYVSMLHLYESFGWWRQPELRKIHYAEEYNELHHLLIMEALGGNARWRDRFLGYHVAFAYYWAVNALFFFSPRAAYEFMELLESHAVDTYGTFCKENEARLKQLPPPKIAVSYYKADDPYMFDDFQVSKKPKTRQPPCDNLYDVFKNICEDEGEHVKTMRACKDYSKLGGMIVSPHYQSGEPKSPEQIEVENKKRREAWLEWSEEVNRASCAEEDF